MCVLSIKVPYEKSLESYLMIFVTSAKEICPDGRGTVEYTDCISVEG